MSVIRRVEASDVPQFFRVRAATGENRLTLDQLAALGINENSVREKLLSSHQGARNGGANKIAVNGIYLISVLRLKHFDLIADALPFGRLWYAEPESAEKLNFKLTHYPLSHVIDQAPMS